MLFQGCIFCYLYEHRQHKYKVNLETFLERVCVWMCGCSCACMRENIIACLRTNETVNVYLSLSLGVCVYVYQCVCVCVLLSYGNCCAHRRINGLGASKHNKLKRELKCNLFWYAIYKYSDEQLFICTLHVFPDVNGNVQSVGSLGNTFLPLCFS